MTKKMLNLGTSDNGEKFALPASILGKHVVVLGASGSGKTVMGKLLVEEAALAGIPSILIDPQGDLASLAMTAEDTSGASASGAERGAERGKPKAGSTVKGTVTAGKDGASPETGPALFRSRAEVRIFTPASLKGIPLSINPLKLPSRGMAEDEKIRAMDLISASLTRLLGFTRGEENEQAGKYLYALLELIWNRSIPLNDFSLFSDIAESPDSVGMEDPDSVISESNRMKVARKLRYLTMGVDKLLFNFGVPSDMDVFMRPVEKGRTPVNVIYLNTLSSEEHKQFFVSMIAEDIYEWMLHHPSKSPQVLFYIDEVAPYLPPHPRNPPAKEMLKMLFKQGRKYGVSCLMCTQNAADVDYKAMAQANTWALGRMMTKQDIEKVRHVIMAAGESDELLSELPTAKPGRFIFLCPDALASAERMDARWLYTVHETLGEDRLTEVMDAELKEHFQQVSKRGTISSPVETQLKETLQSMRRTEEEAVEQRKVARDLKERDSLPGQGKSLSDKLWVGKVNINLPKAMKLARRHLEGNILIKSERLDEHVELRYVPLWQVEFVSKEFPELLTIPLIKMRIPKLGKKVEVENSIYYNADSGRLLQIKGDEINFSNMVSKPAKKIKDLDDHGKIIEFEEKSRDIVHYKPKEESLSRKGVEEKAEHMFGLSVKKVGMVFLPCWEFSITDKTTGFKSNLLVDAATGRRVNLREKITMG